MKLILCLLPLLCLVLYFNSVEAASFSHTELLRETRSTDDSDSDAIIDDGESDADKDAGDPVDDSEDDGGEFVLEPQGTKKLLKLNEKATNLYTNKSEAEISEIQKKLAELKYGFGHNR